MSRTRKGALKSLLFGLILAILITLGAMLLLAAALLYLHVSDAALRLLNQLIKLTAIVLGVRAAVPAIITMAAMKLRKGAFTHGAFSFILCGAALLLTLFTGVNILWIVIAAAVIGIILSEVKRRGIS